MELSDSNSPLAIESVVVKEEPCLEERGMEQSTEFLEKDQDFEYFDEEASNLSTGTSLKRRADDHRSGVIQKESTNNSIASKVIEIKRKVLSGEYKVRIKRGRSKVWNTYGGIETDYGEMLSDFLVCRNCLNIYRYTKNTSSNLVKHKCYINGEPRNTLSVPKIAANNATNAESKNSSSIPKIVADNATKNLAVELFTKWAIKNCRPFKIAEDSGLKEVAEFFVSLGAKVGPNIDIMTYVPNPTMISCNVESMYKINFDKIKSEISKIVDIGYGLTFGVCTDDFLRKSYLALTIHFVMDGNIYCRLLGLKEMDYEGATFPNVLAKVIKLLSDFGCTLNNKATMVTDRGSNMVSSFQPYNQLFCINHLLQNTLQKSLEEVDEISNICKLSCKIVKYFKKSECNSNFVTSLKSFSPTRWNTFYYLFLSIKNHWNEITQFLQEKNELHKFSELKVSDLNYLIEVLELFEEAFTKLESEKNPTLHLVVVHIEKLRRKCSVQNENIFIIKHFKEKILAYLQSMVLKNLNIFHKIALFLFPPANKLLRFENEEKEAIRRATMAIMSEFTENLQSSIPSNAKLSDKNCDLFDRFVTKHDQTNTSRVSEELTMYENIRIPFFEQFDVLKWWDTNKYLFPLLYKTSCRVLAVPASIATSDRVFHAARNLLTEKSCVLGCDSETVNNIMFLHNNDSI